MRQRTRGAKSVQITEDRRLELQRMGERVNATWACVGVLRPDLKPDGKRKLAELLLDLCAAFDPDAQPEPRILIMPAQVTELVWTNSQCIQKSCPMLLFSDRIAKEINAFFNQDE